MGKFFRNRGLITKITWMIAMILIVPTAVICIFYYGSYKKSLLKDANNQLERGLEEREYTMEANLDTVSAVITELDYRLQFPYYLDKRSHLSEREKRYYVSGMEEELINLRYLYPNMFYQIVVYSSNSQIEPNDRWQFGMDTLEKKPYYAEITGSDDTVVYGAVRKADFLTSTLNVDNLNIVKDGKLILPVYLKIRNLSTKEIVGILEMDITVEKLVGDRYLEKRADGPDYLIFGRHGELVFQTGEFGRSETESMDFSGIKAETGISIGRSAYLAAGSHSVRSGLSRVVLISRAGVLKFASDMLVKMILVTVAGIFSIISLTYLLMRRLLNRLIVLDDMMEKVETGQFEIAVEDGGPDDEVTRIIRRFNQMASHLQAVINTAVEKEKAQKEAELSALQAQINPHFLYNTLENMRMQCEFDGYDVIGDSLAALGELFRYSIRWGSHEVPFRMEWENLKNYIAIMNMRYEGDFKCVMEMGEGTGDVIVPKMLLQPLVENSFSHGFKTVLPPWLVVIRAFRKQNKLMVIIEDNGSGIEPERLEQIRLCMRENQPVPGEKKDRSIGIINVKQRLERICGEGGVIDIHSRPDEGVKIVIQINMEEE